LLTLTFSGFSQIDNTTEKISFSKDNYKIQYPKSWRLDTSKVMGTEFFVFSPLENNTDKFKENASLIIGSQASLRFGILAYRISRGTRRIPKATSFIKVFPSATASPALDCFKCEPMQRRLA